MRSKFISVLTIILMLIVVALFGFLFSATSAIENISSESDKVNSLFSFFEEANATVVKIFHQYEGRDVAVPQASTEQYDQACLLANEATTRVQMGNYSEANTLIVEALQKLKESLRILYATASLQPTEFEANLEKAILLNSSISRCYGQLFQIQNVTAVAKTSGFNTTLLEAKIVAAWSFLDEASGSLNEGFLEAASGNLTQAKNILAQLSVSLGELTVDLKVQKLSAYIAEAEVRLDALRAEAISVSNTAPLAYVNQAESSLTSAKEYLAQQLIDQTVVELTVSRNSELQAEAILKPTLNSTSSITGAAGASLTAAAVP